MSLVHDTHAGLPCTGACGFAASGDGECQGSDDDHPRNDPAHLVIVACIPGTRWSGAVSATWAKGLRFTSREVRNRETTLDGPHMRSHH